MKDYELTVLFHPDLEMNLDPALDKVKNLSRPTKAKLKAKKTTAKSASPTQLMARHSPFIAFII